MDYDFIRKIKVEIKPPLPPFTLGGEDIKTIDGIKVYPHGFAIK